MNDSSFHANQHLTCASTKERLISADTPSIHRSRDMITWASAAEEDHVIKECVLITRSIKKKQLATLFV